MEATIAQLGIACAVLLPYILFTGTLKNMDNISGQTVILLLILGGIHTGLAFWLFFSSIPYLKAQAVAVFSYLDPVTAIAVSALLLRETISLVWVFGACLVLGSAFVSDRYGNYNLRK
jgi:drug/metabolite transporter (DMT)-like permease